MAGKLYLRTSKPAPNPRAVRWWIRLLAVPGLVLFVLIFANAVMSLINHWSLKVGDTVDWQALLEHAWHIIFSSGMIFVFGFSVFRGKVPQWLYKWVPHSWTWR